MILFLLDRTKLKIDQLKSPKIHKKKLLMHNRSKTFMLRTPTAEIFSAFLKPPHKSYFLR